MKIGSVQGYINTLLDQMAENRGEIERLHKENRELRKQVNELLRGKECQIHT